MFKIKDHISDNRGLLVSLILLFLATLGSAAFLIYTLLSLNAFVHKGSRDVNTVVQSRAFYSDLQTAETNARGYLISGDPAFLVPYRSAVAAAPQDLQRLTVDERFKNGHHAELMQLQKLSQERLAHLQAAIQLYDSEGQAAALSHQNYGGRQIMDQIQALLGSITGGELKNIDPQVRTSNTNLQRSLFVTPLLVLFVLAMCLVIMRYFQKGINKERGVEGSKNEFLSLASHQLRTPATNVKQYLHLVLDGYFGPIDDQQREALLVADKNNDIEISIINDLLNVAKVDLNQIAMSPVSTKPGQLIRLVVKDYRSVIKKRRQKLSYSEQRKLGTIKIDQTYFRTVLENLIDNASKYSPNGGHISLRSEARKQEYILRIQDDGVGISKNDISKLFKKFSRIPNELSDTVEGSGLGLYWVKRIVELHHGSISVRSKPAAGTEFIIRLPLEPQTK